MLRVSIKTWGINEQTYDVRKLEVANSEKKKTQGYLFGDTGKRMCPPTSFEKLIITETFDQEKSTLFSFHSFAK